MARQRIFTNAAGAQTSAEIQLPYNAAGAFCADISVIFGGTPAGEVAILVEDSAGVFQRYDNLVFTANELKTIELYGTGKIKIDLDGSVTDATVEL